MSQLPTERERERQVENVNLEGTFRGKYRGFAVFLIACAILIAAFAITALCTNASDGAWRGTGGTDAMATTSGLSRPTQATPESSVQMQLPSPDEVLPPAGATPIVERDLSCLSLGEDYIHNETPYTPDLAELLSRSHKAATIGEEILVLIVHTHSSESYFHGESPYFSGASGDETYSEYDEETVLEVGTVLAQTLNRAGIPTLQCTVRQDTEGLSGAYLHSYKTVKDYLEQYPSIRYVIDLHRDAVMTKDGAYIKTLASGLREDTAQVMAVVGSDCNGTPHPNWENNLSLALQLRAKLNEGETGLCRPVSLRKASFNQELAPYSLLLEIGTGGNSMEEAKRCAILVGEALAEIVSGI